MTQLFKERPHKRPHPVGDQNGPITILTPPLRLTFLLGLLIAGGLGLWSVLARIPISVRGTGVLLPVSTINSRNSQTSGTAYWMFDDTQFDWHEQALQFMREPDVLTDLQVQLLTQSILRAGKSVIQSHQASSSAGPGSSTAAAFTKNMNDVLYGRRIPSGTLMLWVKSAANEERLQSSLDKLQNTLRDNKAKEVNIGQKQVILEREFSRRNAYLDQMLSLEAKGYVSKASILQQQAKVDAIQSSIYDNNNELIRLKEQVANAHQGLRNHLVDLINEEMIFAEKQLYLSQVIPNDGQVVNKGDAVLELSSDDLGKITLVPLFLDSREMAQVFPGMPAVATPAGYKRSEVGGIRAEVVSMAKIPSSEDFVTARVGVESLAQEIIQLQPTPTLAVLKLELQQQSGPRNTGGYAWTSGGDLPFPPTPGDRLDVEITTRDVAPIQLVLPALRRFFGWSPPRLADPSGFTTTTR